MNDGVLRDSSFYDWLVERSENFYNPTEAKPVRVVSGQAKIQSFHVSIGPDLNRISCITIRLLVTIGGGTGEHWGTVPGLNPIFRIRTLTLWVLHEKIEAKSRWCPRLGGAVLPLVLVTC